MLAYAYILTHEGYPWVFWKDYFNYHLAKEGTPNGIEALIRIHEQYAGGTTSVLHADDDLHIMERNGTDKQEGLIFVLNNRGDAWNGRWVKTKWQSTKLTPTAWGTNAGNIEAPME